MSIGQRIRKRRQELNLTQQDLADALGLTPQHISLIEQDRRVPSLLSLVKLAEELGVTIGYLATGKVGLAIGAIPAIKADKKLSLKAKKAIIKLIEELYRAGEANESRASGQS
ncbi:MAG: helix-turn-helix domain-containing protein [Dehalococcoidia bacterium]